MLLRWLSAAIGIPLYVGVCLWGVKPFSIGVLALAVLGLIELLRTYWSQGIRANVFLAASGLFVAAWMQVLIQLYTFRYIYLLEALILLPVPLALVWEVVRAARTGKIQVARNLAYGLLCGMYVALFGFLTWLRADIQEVNAGLFPSMERGAALLLLTTFCVWATDSCALFVGRARGRRKLAPKLSPGKTVEGAVGGLVAGLLVGALFGGLLLGNISFGLAVGAMAGVFGQIGDLFESALKREAGVKDFGGLLPGHGGVLDRFDSLLFVGPFVALLFLLWPR